MEYNVFQANTFLTDISLFRVMAIILSPLPSQQKGIVKASRGDVIVAVGIPER